MSKENVEHHYRCKYLWDKQGLSGNWEQNYRGKQRYWIDKGQYIYKKNCTYVNLRKTGNIYWIICFSFEECLDTTFKVIACLD